MMRSIKVFSFVIFIILSSLALSSPLSPEHIIQRLYRGEKMLPPIESMNIIFNLKKNLQGQDIKDWRSLDDFSRGQIFFKKPNKLRVESTLTCGNLAGIQFLVIRDGFTYWLYQGGVHDQPMRKRTDPKKPYHLLPFNIQTYPEDIMREYTLLGEEGDKSYIIGITNKIDPERSLIKVWIDKSKWVPLKVEVTKFRKNEKIKSNTLYKEIKKTAEGRWFPTLLEYYENERLQEAIIYEKIAINKDLPDSLFAPQSQK